MPHRFAVIGKPIEHSLSPDLHNYLLAGIGVDGIYERREVANGALGTEVSNLKKLGFRGLNITIPHKQAISSFLARVSEEASVIGAVNTVLIEDQELSGFNTDYSGFASSLAHRGVDLEASKVVVLGAGGAARAVVFSLIKNGVGEICVFARTLGRALDLVGALSTVSTSSTIQAKEWQTDVIYETLAKSSLLVNATPVGMWPALDQTPLKIESPSRHLAVVDLIYNPLETIFLRSAKQQGALVIDGLDMFIYQGVAALKIWLGREIQFDFDGLRTHLIGKLKTHGKH